MKQTAIIIKERVKMYKDFELWNKKYKRTPAEWVDLDFEQIENAYLSDQSYNEAYNLEKHKK